MQDSSSLSEEQREAAVALFEVGWGAKAAATRLGVRSKAVIRIHALWSAQTLVAKAAKLSNTVCNYLGCGATAHGLFSESALGYSARMATERRKWKYRDPSWPQIVWLYGLSLIIGFVDLRQERVFFGLGLTVLVTVLVAVKMFRERRGKLETDPR